MTIRVKNIPDTLRDAEQAPLSMTRSKLLMPSAEVLAYRNVIEGGFCCRLSCDFERY